MFVLLFIMASRWARLCLFVVVSGLVLGALYFTWRHPPIKEKLTEGFNAARTYLNKLGSPPPDETWGQVLARMFAIVGLSFLVCVVTLVLTLLTLLIVIVVTK